MKSVTFMGAFAVLTLPVLALADSQGNADAGGGMSTSNTGEGTSSSSATPSNDRDPFFHPGEIDPSVTNTDSGSSVTRSKVERHRDNEMRGRLNSDGISNRPAPNTNSGLKDDIDPNSTFGSSTKGTSLPR